MTDTTTEPVEVEDNTPDDPVEDAQEVEETEPDTFPREYVEKLRKEAADARVKAKDRDDLAHRLHATLVASTGRLADPSDLPFDQSHLDDPEALTAAIEDLLDRKPHLASRTPRGDVGQGRSTHTDPVDLAGILRSRS